jgi:hypothetical protein
VNGSDAASSATDSAPHSEISPPNSDDLLIRIGDVLAAAGIAFVVYYLHTRSWIPAAAGDQACLEFYRSELVRQRDLLRGVWWWYLLPFVPGMLVITIGRVAAEPALAPGAAIGTLIALLLFLGIGKLNDLAAKKIQQDIDALDLCVEFLRDLRVLRG